MDSLSQYPQYFMRQFTFQKTKEWVLPNKIYKAPKFKIPETQDMKTKLNNVKGQLSRFDLAQWSKHTAERDIAGYVMDFLRKKVKPELLTQAWCKFYEIINTFSVINEIVSNSEEKLTSLHLCEAPGAFVCALNHYLTLEHSSLNWEWTANTLNPNYEGTPLSQMISDDRLIRHTLKNWEFGLDSTGDIKKYYNHEAIVKRIVSNGGKVSLVTADGSINCMSDPGEQERLVEFLHYCETITALAVVKKGGTFILKIFTIFEDTSISLIYLLNCLFQQVSVFKPCTSKSGNSEVYVICKGFFGLETITHLWEDLLQPYKNGDFGDVSMFSKNSIPNSFYLQVLNCSEYFMERQVSTIQDNIYYYLHPDKTESAVLHKLKTGIAVEYLRRFKLNKYIPSYRKIVPYNNMRKRKFEETSLFYLSKNSLSINEDCLSGLIDIKIGKRIEKVHNSKFILERNMEMIANSSGTLESPKHLYNTVCDYLSNKNIVINVSNFKLTPYYSFQKSLFFKVKDIIFSNKNLIFINIPFCTHFLAGLWCIMATAFEKVYFFTGLVVFHNLLPSQTFAKNVFNEIEKKYHTLKNGLFSEDILQILEPEVFDNTLNVISHVLDVCNSPCLPV